MAFAVKRDGVWVEIFGAFKVNRLVNAEMDEVSYPANWLDLASADDRAEIGVLEIEEPAPLAAGLRVTGSTIEGDETPRRIWHTEAIPLADLRADAMARVNAGAGAFRRRFITDISGQQATYLAKEQEAKAWTNGADPTDFPYLATEAAETGKSIGYIAALVLETATVWRALDPRIEGKRRGAAVAIEAATTAEGIASAADVNWAALLG